MVSSNGKTLTWDMPITSDSVPNLQVDAVFIQNDQIYEASKNIKVPPVSASSMRRFRAARRAQRPGR